MFGGSSTRVELELSLHTYKIYFIMDLATVEKEVHLLQVEIAK